MRNARLHASRRPLRFRFFCPRHSLIFFLTEMSAVYNLVKPPADAVMHASDAFGKADWLSCSLHWCLSNASSVEHKNYLFRCVCELPSDIRELLVEERFSVTAKVMVTTEVFEKLKSLMAELNALVAAAGPKHAPTSSKPVKVFFSPGLDFFSRPWRRGRGGFD